MRFSYRTFSMVYLHLPDTITLTTIITITIRYTSFSN